MVNLNEERFEKYIKFPQIYCQNIYVKNARKSFASIFFLINCNISPTILCISIMNLIGTNLLRFERFKTFTETNSNN